MSATETREGPAVAAASAPRDSNHIDGADFRSAGLAEQAALFIEGEDYARAFLGRLHADEAQPDELAALVGFCRGGAMLRGFCRVISKALGVRHG